MSFTRAGDRWKMPATIAGFLLLLIFGWMMLVLPADRQPTDIVKYVLLGVGAGLISPGFIVDLVRLWRNNNTQPPSAGATT